MPLKASGSEKKEWCDILFTVKFIAKKMRGLSKAGVYFLFSMPIF